MLSTRSHRGGLKAAFVATLAAMVMIAPAANADPIPPDPPDPFNEGPTLDISQMPPKIDQEQPAEVLPLSDSPVQADSAPGIDADAGTTAVPSPPRAPSNLPQMSDAAPGGNRAFPATLTTSPA